MAGGSCAGSSGPGRRTTNRDLPPGVYRRTRGGKTRYYDSQGRALGSDRQRAAEEVLRRAADPIGQTAGTWRNASRLYRDWMDSPACELKPKTVVNYRKALAVLDKVFGAAMLAEIKPASLGAIKREMVDRQL